MLGSRLLVLVRPPSPRPPPQPRLPPHATPSWKNCMQCCTITQNKYRKGGGRIGWGTERSSGLHQWKAFHKNCYRVKSLQWFQFHLLAANQKTETARWPPPPGCKWTLTHWPPGLHIFLFLLGFHFSIFWGEWGEAKNILSSRCQFLHKTIYKQVCEEEMIKLLSFFLKPVSLSCNNKLIINASIKSRQRMNFRQVKKKDLSPRECNFKNNF